MTAPVNISVLVPVYNVEPYLAQCLESICSQTLRELEIVCVDDASTDGSLSILREFAERDPRVKVVQAPENGGLSRSRNLAMSHAVGEYLFLVDSDDWLETDLLEEMYRRAKALDADRLACGFRYYYESAPRPGGSVSAGGHGPSGKRVASLHSGDHWENTSWSGRHDDQAFHCGKAWHPVPRGRCL